jgi:TonB family protein
MPEKNLFKVALIVSLAVHGAIFFQNSTLSLFSALKLKTQPQPEVSYFKDVGGHKEELRTREPAKKEPFLKIPPKPVLDKKLPPPFVEREEIFKPSKASGPRNPVYPKPVFIRPDVIAIKKKITLPPIEIGKIDNPSYITYYQIVREKIKRAAYQNYTGSEVGEVTMSFVIDSQGLLKELRLAQEKSSPSAYLREIALRSVRDASLFPRFPKELDYPRLSFNLTITFEVE